MAAVFGTVVFFYGGWTFIQGGYHELRDRLPGMMVLISLAISVAFLYSLLTTLGVVEGMDLWWALATLVAIMLLGHWIEMRSITQAQGALRELARLLPDMAMRLTRDGGTREVPVDELRQGDVVLIRPGAGVPADGKVLEGKSALNESMITGESRPVGKSAGDRVIAGSVNGQGSLRVEVTGTGDKTALAGIMRLVEDAQSSRSRAQALADRAAFYLAIVAVGAAVITALAWLLSGREGDFTIDLVVTVLVIACPHAVGLAIPLVIAISTSVGAPHGLLVRDRRGLEDARLLDMVVFDKTGTLTLGSHRVIDYEAVEGLNRKEALRLAAAVQQDAEHPIADALLTSAREEEVNVPGSQNFESLPGRGVRATVEGRKFHVGGPGLLRQFKVEPPQALARAAQAAADNGQSAKIGRAACRERAWHAVVGAAVKEKNEHSANETVQHGR